MTADDAFDAWREREADAGRWPRPSTRGWMTAAERQLRDLAQKLDSRHWVRLLVMEIGPW